MKLRGTDIQRLPGREEVEPLVMPHLGEVPRRCRAHKVNKGEARVALLLDANGEVPHSAPLLTLKGLGARSRRSLRWATPSTTSPCTHDVE